MTRVGELNLRGVIVMFLFQGVKVIYRTKELEEQQSKRLEPSLIFEVCLLDFEVNTNTVSFLFSLAYILQLV